MRRRARYYGIAGWALCFLAPGSPARTADTPVIVNSNFYSPQHATVLVGDTVTWSLVAGFHNVRADDSSFRCGEGGCSVPAGTVGDPSFDWGTATLLLTAPGLKPYHCEVHGVGMNGSVRTLRSIFADAFEGGNEFEWAAVDNTGDNCNNSIVIGGNVNDLPGSLIGARNDYDLTVDGTCFVAAAHGRDRYYQFILAAGAQLDVTVAPVSPGFDPVIYLHTLTSCFLTPPVTCLDRANDGGAGASESISYTNIEGSAVTVELVVDTLTPAAAGSDYTLTASMPTLR
jgi:plastocyanin